MSISAIKGLGALVTFSGLSYGGREVYLIAQSGDWEDELKRQGVRLPDAKDKHFYDGVVKDQSSYISSQPSLKDKTTGDNLKQWCEAELKKKFNRWGSNNDSTLKTLQKVCSVSGVTKIKGWLIAKMPTTTEFIQDLSDPTDQEKEYKRIFSLYRYGDEKGQSELLDWLNEGVEENAKLNKDSKVSENYKKLENKCKSKLGDEHQHKAEPLSSRDLQNVLKWCVKMKESAQNDTIANRLKYVNREKIGDGEKNNLKTKWEHTTQVVSEIKKVLSKKQELENKDYLDFCGDTYLNQKLTDDEQYQFRYIVLGSVCYKAKNQTLK